MNVSFVSFLIFSLSFFFFFKGCMERLEYWYKEQYIVFLVAGLIMVIIESMVLLSTILACTRLYKFKRQTKELNKVNATPKTNENDIYQRKSTFSDNAYTMSNSFRQNYKLIDRA